MADRPLRPATHRRLGRPLPHQQANGPRAHLDAEAEASFPLAGTSGISSSFLGLSRSSRQVTHVLLTRSRLCPRASPGSSLHLHVLSTPPAFVLSQYQTLREVGRSPVRESRETPPWHTRRLKAASRTSRKACHGFDRRLAATTDARSRYTRPRTMTGYFSYLLNLSTTGATDRRSDSAERADPAAGRTWTHTTIEVDRRCACC